MRPPRIEPGPGQESVWDYPRPPAVQPTAQHIRVVHAGVVLADTRAAVRVLETSQPPAYYLPAQDVAMEHLARSAARSLCEWKGLAEYWSIRIEHPTGAATVVADAAWSYPTPTPQFESIAGYVAFYAQLVDECWVGDEQVAANAGSFYGGWITSGVVGPFKGAPGTSHW
jgi:uncharacterized protein (DUF427 family)